MPVEFLSDEQLTRFFYLSRQDKQPETVLGGSFNERQEFPC
jgi:hypothetical protein